MSSNRNNNNHQQLQLMQSRKRSAVETSLTLYDELDEEPPLRRFRKDVLTCELETLQAELDHERSLRALDAKRFVQEKQRMEKQLQFAIEETQDANKLLEETQRQHDQYVEQLKRARNQAQAELRQVQDALGEERAVLAADALEDDPRLEHLREEVKAKETENKSLQGIIVSLKEELERKMDLEAATGAAASRDRNDKDTVSANALSEARPDVLKELNRVRILLADSERKNRQFKRAVEEAAQKSKQLIHEKERLRTANKRIEQVEAELHQEIKRGETTAAELQKLQDEHKTVLEKFGKLRDAVYAERSKAEQALQRADQAEALAGKGSFDPEKTRVLHLSNNPLTEALKEEINVLKRQVEVLSASNKKKKPLGSDVDPNKLHQRLKQSFKEQIGRFREGVYLMTGYKIDMIPGPDNDKYKFKVRSVFAENESDLLMFQWPEGEEVTSLDMLSTEHAKALTQSPSGQYLTKFHSLPAFMASVQLTLFEKQTIMI
ncbi:mitotic checkpoint protein [Nitzschia inconspicua]|uniref:Mitotic checkpoint protein n=1 Tax=Nitzschia inconspicua TaxID=303405 RepID=A0A9K3LJF3_9STRA|nr:mitotic checkpoint protein [Nitzschia inconspicua]